MARDGWFLGLPKNSDGKELEPWDFVTGKPFAGRDGPFTAPIKETGTRAAISFGAFDILYASGIMADRLLQVVGADEIQLIPVAISGVDDGFSIINVLQRIKCVDEEKSVFEKWLPGNSARPDKAGEYKMIEKLRVEPVLAQGRHIFRLWGWSQAVVVSERVKEVVEAYGSADTVFIPVS